MKKSILLVFALILTIYPVLALECGEVITEDTIMTEDLIDCSAGGLIIGANDIALDCAGHLIDGTRVFSTGIEIINKEGILLKNCIIKDFHGGIRLENSHNNIFSENIMNHNEEGFSVLYSNNNLFENNEASSNIWEGFYVDGINNTLIKNIANNNKMEGMKIKGSKNLITNNILMGNRKGIDVTRTQYDFEIKIENNTISYNNFSG